MSATGTSRWSASCAALELEPLLDGIVTSAEAGARKPAPAIFEQALELAGVPADDAIHVGDTLDEDVAGARAAGIEPVLIRRGERPGRAGRADDLEPGRAGRTGRPR